MRSAAQKTVSQALHKACSAASSAPYQVPLIIILWYLDYLPPSTASLLTTSASAHRNQSFLLAAVDFLARTGCRILTLLKRVSLTLHLRLLPLRFPGWRTRRALQGPLLLRAKKGSPTKPWRRGRGRVSVGIGVVHPEICQTAVLTAASLAFFAFLSSIRCLVMQPSRPSS